MRALVPALIDAPSPYVLRILVPGCTLMKFTRKRGRFVVKYPVMPLRRHSRLGTALFSLLAAGSLLTGCTLDTSGDSRGANDQDSPAASAPASATSRDREANVSPEESPAPQFTEASVTIRSVGDILIHSEVYADAATNATAAGGAAAAAGYDFAPMLTPVAKYMLNADITTANMEVPVAGPAFELSGYPAFNSPPQIIDALKDAAVDIVNNATNHSMDRGTGGVEASTSNMRERGMLYMGSFASPQDRATPRIIERNGLKVGFLAYSYGTNGIPVPAGEEYAVNLIDPELMRADITELRDDVDILIVNLHAGEEYEPLPVQSQIDAADTARKAGADFVLGGHPHILEPFQRYPENEPGLGVWFSHGNFLHGQYDEKTKFGGIGEYTITRHTDGTLSLDRIRFMPTYTVGMPYTPDYTVIPLADAGRLGWVDAHHSRADIAARMNTYTPVEVVDYLD